LVELPDVARDFGETPALALGETANVCLDGAAVATTNHVPGERFVVRVKDRGYEIVGLGNDTPGEHRAALAPLVGVESVNPVGARGGKPAEQQTT
jgi:hypothetical protein